MRNHDRKYANRGYSLIEMLVVLAIIGILSLVSVPAFMTLRNGMKMRIAMRTFTTDVRSARQMAITRGRQMRVSFTPGADPVRATREYNIFEGDRAYGNVPAANWRPMTGPGSNPFRGTMELSDVVYFPTNTPTGPQTFTDLTGDGAIDVIFYPDGRAQMPGNTTSGTITLRTKMSVPKSIYQVRISPTGRVIAQ